MPLSWNLGTLTSWNPLGYSRPVTGLIYLLPIGYSITELLYNTAGCTILFHCSLHLCRQSSRNFEQQHVFLPGTNWIPPSAAIETRHSAVPRHWCDCTLPGFFFFFFFLKTKQVSFFQLGGRAVGWTTRGRCNCNNRTIIVSNSESLWNVDVVKEWFIFFWVITCTYWQSSTFRRNQSLSPVYNSQLNILLVKR